MRRSFRCSWRDRLAQSFPAGWLSLFLFVLGFDILFGFDTVELFAPNGKNLVSDDSLPHKSMGILLTHKVPGTVDVGVNDSAVRGFLAIFL